MTQASVAIGACLALLLPLTQAGASDLGEVLRSGESAVLELANERFLTSGARLARRALGPGRSTAIRRWSTCRCFELGVQGRPIYEPDFNAGCLWFESLGERLRDLRRDPRLQAIRECAAALW